MNAQLKALNMWMAPARRVALLIALAVSALGISAPAAPAAAADAPDTTVVAGPFTVVASVEHVSGDAWRFTYSVTNNSVVSDYTGIPAWQYAWENGIDHSGLGGLALDTAAGVSFSDVTVPPPSFTGGVSDGAVDHYGYWDWTTSLVDGSNHGEFWGHEPMAIYPAGKTVTFSFVASPVYPGTGPVKLTAYWYANALRYAGDPTKWFTYYQPNLPVPVLVETKTPSEVVADAIAAGTLTGLGPNDRAAAGRLNAFQHMLAEAEAAIAAGDTAGACTALATAHSHGDGEPVPPDFVTGAARGQVEAAIDAEMSNLGCSRA